MSESAFADPERKAPVKHRRYSAGKYRHSGEKFQAENDHDPELSPR